MKNLNMFKSLNRAISTPVAIIIIVVVGILAIGGVLAYQYWWPPEEVERAEVKTPADETTDWETYRNEEYGYEVRYPSDWKFYDEKIIITFCGPEYWQQVGDCRMAGKGSTAAIILRNDSLDINKEGFCHENPLNIFCGEIFSQKEAVIGERDGKIFEMDIDNGSIVALWKKASTDDRMYKLSADELKDFPGHQDISNLMLSTFKFTEKEQAKTPSLNIDNLLTKMFPGYKVENGKIRILKDELVDVEISIDKTIKDDPLSLDENRILLIAEMTGVPHFYGGYRAFLSVFDLKGNPLTSPFFIPKPVGIDDLVSSLENFLREDGAFTQKGSGQFFFYNCRGTKYILFETKFCVVAMCYGSANLYKVEGSKFINVQKFDSMVIPGEDKISIYLGKSVSEGFICPTECLNWSGKPIETITRSNVYIFYKDEELYWDNNSCRFE